jgi:hypothetical protein
MSIWRSIQAHFCCGARCFRVREDDVVSCIAGFMEPSAGSIVLDKPVVGLAQTAVSFSSTP